MVSKNAEKELPYVGPKINALIKDGKKKKKHSMYQNYLIALPPNVGSQLKCKQGLDLTFAIGFPSYLNKCYPCLEKQLPFEQAIPIDWRYYNL